MSSEKLYCDSAEGFTPLAKPNSALQSATTFKVAWFMPGTLCLYGGRGTIAALERMAKDLGLDFQLDEIKHAEGFDPQAYDFVYFQPGQPEFVSTIRAEFGEKLEVLRQYVDAGGMMLVESSSVAMFGSSIKFSDGTVEQGFGWFDFTTQERNLVESDDIIFAFVPQGNIKSERFKTFTVTDEYFTPAKAIKKNIMMGIGAQVSRFEYINISETDMPFGKILYGIGNGDQSEGFRLGNAWFTNVIGPLLFLNPHLAYYIVSQAMQKRGIEVRALSDDFMHMAEAAISARLEYIATKSPETRGLLHPQATDNLTEG